MDPVDSIAGVGEGIDAEVIVALGEQAAEGQLAEEIAVDDRRGGDQEGEHDDKDDENGVKPAAEPREFFHGHCRQLGRRR